MSGQALTANELDIRRLWDSSRDPAQCKRETRTENGAKTTRTDVPIVTCACRWRRFQREAEDWIAPGGQLIADPQLRNRRINAAYAQLWLADKRFQWAGLAAFASKQVGCGLLHASQTIEKSLEQMRENAWAPSATSNTDVAMANMVPSTSAAGAGYVHQKLVLGNTALFLDIYPLHRFYSVNGLAELETCLRNRQKLATESFWPVAKDVGFGLAFPEIFRAFKAIEAGDIQGSVLELAAHEQLNILQPAIYQDPVFETALRANQASWVTGFPSGVAEEAQLTLAAQCKVNDSRSIGFSNSAFANLAEKDQRMEFVRRAAGQFDRLLKGPQRAQVEQSIRVIANGGGVSR
jgi:hypothetical protein